MQSGAPPNAAPCRTMQHPTARRLYVESQERHVRALLEAQLAQHQARLEALRRRQRESADYEVGISV